MNDEDVTTEAVDSLNASVGIDFTAPEWTQPSPALAAIAMREWAAEVCKDRCDIFWSWPEQFACIECEEEIRALPTTFTDAELNAAVMQVPTVQALVEAAQNMLDLGDNGTELRGDDHLDEVNRIWREFRAALVPFMKGGE